MRTMISASALFAMALWGGTMLITGTRAQEPNVETRPSTRGALTESALGQMLEDMGYEPKKLKQGYLVAIKQDAWTYYVQLVLSPNREKIGLKATMGIVDDPTSIPAGQWLNLLSGNTDIAPSFFYFNKTNNTLYMHRIIDNRVVTPALIRQQVDAFCANIKDTSELWKFTK